MIGALAGSAVVPAAGRHRNLVEAIHDLAVLSLECEVNTARQLAQRGFALRRRDVEFVRPDMVVAFTAERNLQQVEDRAIELLARLDIPDDELDVIDQAAAMQFLRFHGCLR